MISTFQRHIEKDLLVWKKTPDRKPLILRGARQIGKTTVVKRFAQTYSQFIDLNLEKETHKRYFEIHNDINTLAQAIFLDQNKKPDWNNTLLFIDEIQESPKAIQMLRYFYEELPEIHVIAAGSLLEFAIGNVRSFPVGRVEYRYVHPMNFSEFLEANGLEQLLGELNTIPVRPLAHTTLLRHFHKYAIIGGMPEVVKTYVRDQSLLNLPRIYESIWNTYQDDVEKYGQNDVEKKVIKHIMRTAPTYLDERITFQNFGNSNYRSREVSEAFRSLDDAKVIQLIYPVVSTEFPLQPDIKKSARLQFLDSGLVNHALGIQSRMLEIDDLSQTYKGKLTPHLVTQEIMSVQTLSYQKPNFWVRQKKQSQAEVDLVIPHQGMLIPVEVKSGPTGSLRSLHQFMNQSPHPYAIRVYAGEFRIEHHNTPEGTSYILMNLPYYLGTKIHEYIAYFINSLKQNPL